MDIDLTPLVQALAAFALAATAAVVPYLAPLLRRYRNLDGRHQEFVAGLVEDIAPSSAAAADGSTVLVEHLTELEKSLANDVFQARFKNFTNRLNDTATIRKTRQDLARVKTILTERADAAIEAAVEEKA